MAKHAGRKSGGPESGKPVSGFILPAEPILAFFAAIAREEGWDPGGELDAYRDRSTYFSFADESGAVMGGLQLVAPDADGTLPCAKVWPEMTATLAENKGTITHVAMLAIAKQYRSRRGEDGATAFWKLTAAMWNHCVRRGITELWLEATPKRSGPTAWWAGRSSCGAT